jgi:hypothetical protein
VRSFNRRGAAAGSGTVIERTGTEEGGRGERPPRTARRGAGPARRRADLAALAAAVAVALGARWLYAPREGYLVALGVATAVALGAGLAAARRARTRRGRGARGGWVRAASLAFALLAVVFLGVAVGAQRELGRVERRWPATSAARRDAALEALAVGVREEAARAQALAREALARVPAGSGGTAEAFAALAPLASADPERSVAVLGRDRPIAWAGLARVAPDALPGGVAITLTPFYAVLHATVEAPDGRRGVAQVLLHAERPADTLSAPLDRQIVERLGSGAVTWAAPAALPDAEPGWRTLEAGGRPLAVVRARVPTATEARLRTEDDARRRGVPLVFAMSAVLVAAVWRRPASLRRRLAVLAVPLGVVALAPLNALSNVSVLFDPALYYARIGGPLTASVGALLLSGALLLLALFAVLRSGRQPASRGAALAVVLALGALAPYLLRALSRGIAPPARGVDVALWVAWQVALFLPAAALLVAAAAAGRAALGPGRGMPPLVAPVIAAIAAVGAPVLWAAPSGWPAWYAAPWVAALVALALTRRTRAMLVAATAVAGLGAAVLVWSATARERVALAERDVAGLVAPDPEMLDLLARFGTTLASDAAAREGPFAPGGLLRRWAQSPLGSADYPVGDRSGRRFAGMCWAALDGDRFTSSFCLIY